MASKKFSILCTTLREDDTEAEVEDIKAIKPDCVLLVLTEEDNAEFD